MTVAILDYGAGNLPSVERAFRRLGTTARRASRPDDMAGASALVLPGVGHFAALVGNLAARNLFSPLRKKLQEGVPFLGICLGLQALYETSEEAPGVDGLKLLAGSIASLPSRAKLPHMGWNQLLHLKPSVLLRGIPQDAYFYFAHSYAAPAPDVAAVAECHHGSRFVAVLERDNLFAVQFHPEKSGQVGAHVLQNFLEQVG